MFSADNTGQIIVWKTVVTDSQQLQPCHQWCIEMVQRTILLDHSVNSRFNPQWSYEEMTSILFVKKKNAFACELRLTFVYMLSLGRKSVRGT